MGVLSKLSVYLLALLLFVCRLSGAVDEADVKDMSPADLLAMEQHLKLQLTEVDVELDSLKSANKKLQDEQAQVDREAETLNSEKRKELAEKETQEKELEKMKASLAIKRTAIGKLSIHLAELQEHVSKLQQSLNIVAREKDLVEQKYNDPSLVDVLETRSRNWNVVHRQILLKAIRSVHPVISEMQSTAYRYRQRLRRSSHVLEIIVSLLLYGFIVGSFYVISRIYFKVKANFTIDRMLFLGDAFCACFWTLVLLCSLFIWGDPMRVAQSRSPVAFFIFQLAVLGCFVFYVMLRILLLTSNICLVTLGEVLAIIVVGQHYYIRIWQPVILDETPQGNIFYYICYVWLFAAFAHRRITQFSPLKQLRGPQLSTWSSVRVMFARFSRSNIPRGDIDSTMGRYDG